MTPEEQRADDVRWIEAQLRMYERDVASARGGHRWTEIPLLEKEAARYRRILAALTAKPVAWRIEGEEVNEEWSGSFDYITDDAGVAEESDADGHKVTPLCPCFTVPQTPQDRTASAATPPVSPA